MRTVSMPGDTAGAIALATLALLQVVAFPRAAEAQTQPRTIRACYVAASGGWPPSRAGSGEIYLIGEQGLANQCRERSHVQISWTSGGSSGTATGDLAGAYPGPSVAALRGRPLAATAPRDGQVLAWDQRSASWMPVTLPARRGPPSAGAQRCPPGQVMVGLDGNGRLVCEPGAATAAECTGNELVPHLMRVSFDQRGAYGVSAPAVALATFDVPCQFLRSDGNKPGGAVQNFTMQIGTRGFDQRSADEGGPHGLLVRGGRAVGMGMNMRVGNAWLQMGADGRVVTFSRAGGNMEASVGGQMIARLER